MDILHLVRLHKNRVTPVNPSSFKGHVPPLVKVQMVSPEPHKSLPSLLNGLEEERDRGRMTRSTTFLTEITENTDSDSDTAESGEIQGFKKTNDFGDFQIFSNTPPVKPHSGITRKK